jgi:dGTPase
MKSPSFTASLISFDDLRGSVPQAADLIDTVEGQYPGASPRVRFWEVQRQLMNLLIGGLIEGTVQAAKDSRIETIADLRALEHRIAQLSPQPAIVHSHLKQLLASRAYSAPHLSAERRSAVEKIRRLFAFLVENPHLVSAGYREHLEETPPHRVICDYIAGMTDGYFNRVYFELLGD